MLILRIILFSVSLPSLIYSYICLFRPDSGIRIFQAWCRFLNWKVEPIRYDFEVKNTRKFGIVGLVLGLVLLYKAIFM